ncbi:MAG TPA: transcriptional repressor LexA [Citreicella sp.]|jgi:repressor LexA|uniref:LexA repressor n=1 Tax=Salipiger marinus TaxID=555512 RepID=A0A1G8N5C3_9RHOB|nr:transcriptional repressor LexA [Salipiger marinus]SDI75368.1 SOS-response transcriptional repressor, LexA [Salipiger marinus]HBM61264.1 transcriptional repressor LexA [Citreicella sp.]HBS99818.1 transcriptional repressor LexA [Citreicella sp.]
MLTKKQLDLLDFINQRLLHDGVPPSFDEMKDALDLRSKSGIHRLITALEERGFIRRLAHRARAIEIVKLPESLGGRAAGFVAHVVDGDRPDARPAKAQGVESAVDAMELPLLGRIAAGVPIESISEIPPQVAVPGSMLASNAHHYALEVKGDSMIEAGINDGDVVIIRETTSAENGDIVVAQVEGYEATLKRFRRRGDRIVLEAANPAYEPRVLPMGSVRVQGRLVGLIRTY